MDGQSIQLGVSGVEGRHIGIAPPAGTIGKEERISSAGASAAGTSDGASALLSAAPQADRVISNSGTGSGRARRRNRFILCSSFPSDGENPVIAWRNSDKELIYLSTQTSHANSGAEVPINPSQSRKRFISLGKPAR